jgi:hypothetical protein
MRTNMKKTITVDVMTEFFELSEDEQKFIKKKKKTGDAFINFEDISDYAFDRVRENFHKLEWLTVKSIETKKP